MESRPIPLIGQAWVLSGFAYEFDQDQDRPHLLAAPGETPMLNLPDGIGWEDLEDAFGAAIAKLFLQRYGLLNLVQGIRSWDRLVADMQTGQDLAAD
jgi:hypothetical protein